MIFLTKTQNLQFVFSMLFNPLNLLILFIVVAALLLHISVYRKSSYYQMTKLSYFSVIFDPGRFGEYLIYNHLKKYENDGAKFLFNTYIPKEDGSTTEIDVLMLSAQGIFVFESKNYSGWIFGNQSQENWYQTLPQGKGKSHKEAFYNPIMQNNSHIKHLKAFIGENYQMHSVIAFSDRCELKNITLKSDNVYVAKRSDIPAIVSKIVTSGSVPLINENEISDIYAKLYPCTQVDVTVKEQHIANLKEHKDEKNDTNLSIIENNTPSLSSENELPKETNAPKSCPKCGKTLILRTATKGNNVGKQFYGCSNYPKCRYIQKIS